MQKQRMERVIAASHWRVAHPQRPTVDHTDHTERPERAERIERLDGRALRRAQSPPVTAGALALLETIEDVAAHDTDPLLISQRAFAERRILIVEDDLHVAELLRHALELEGEPTWAVHMANEGRHALDLAVTVAPQVILLDVRLPGLDGAEIYHRLRANPLTAQTRILFVTAATSLDLHMQGIEGGILLRKPFDVHEVAALVRALLAASR